MALTEMTNQPIVSCKCNCISINIQTHQTIRYNINVCKCCFGKKLRKREEE